MEGNNSSQNLYGLDEDITYRDDSDRSLSEESSKPYIDENVRNAIELRQKKSKVTDFYLKLAELKDRIDVY